MCPKNDRRSGREIETPVMMDDLPESARNIARLIGMEKAMRLFELMGGVTIAIPKGNARYGQTRYKLLAEIIGENATDILTAEYGGEMLYIPNCKDALMRARDRDIQSRFEELIKTGLSANKSVAELSRQYRLSDRRVWSILKSMPAPVKY